MHALALKRLSRKLTLLISVLFLASCGQGDGPVSIAGTAATPLPDLPPDFCDGINFEVLCAPPTIANFNGGATTIIDNPDASGIDDSEKVAQMQKFPDDPTLLFGGTSLGLDSSLDFANGTAFKIKVWSQRDVRMIFKLEAGQPVDQFASRELEQTVNGSSAWEELCYDFAGGLPTLDVFGIVIIFDNGVAGAADTDPTNWTFYYDDIEQVANCGGGGGSGASPTVAAPTPTAAAGDVISLFSDAYTDVVGVDYNPNWGQATVVTQEDIAGSNTLKYAGLNFQGTDFASNPQDVSGMDSLHVDFWSEDSTALNVFLISAGPVEAAFALPVAPNTWVSVDIPLTAFAGVDLANVIQLKFDGNGTVFLDNLYFTNGGGQPATEPVIAAPTPTDAAGDVISLFSDAYTDIAGIDYNPNWGQATVVTQEVIASNNTLKYAGLDFQGTDFSGNAQDVSGMNSLHLDFWTADSTALNVFLISPGPTETAFALTVTPFTWVSVDIPLTAFAGVDLANVIQMKIDGNGTIFFDNLYFTTRGGGGGPAAGELTTNGDLETGDLTGWTTFLNGGSITVVADNGPSAAGTSAANVNVTIPGNPTLKQANLAAGQLTPGQQVTVSFDWKGTDAIGGVVDAVLFSELAAGGVSQTDQILSGAGFPANWTTVGPLNINIGPDVSGGVTLQITAICGGDAGCVSDIFIDNVSISVPAP